MRRVALTLAAVFAAGGALTGTAQATPAVGEVIVYSLDTMPVEVFDNPRGCYSIPVCALLPILTLQEDTGAHAPPAAGSFRV
ncbi:hypothetical protein [Crossiella sp. CA198]|uniref:hypothetical protein n=1 Tax=Crossiella sp. CA198 TaxID=3455607 RepID=UPI003F8D726F